MQLDLQYAVEGKKLDALKEASMQAFHTLVEKSGAGNDFLGWVSLPQTYDREEYARIQKAADKIRKEVDALVVIGIGGSYLGARAVIEALTPTYQKAKPEILYAGNHLSAPELVELMQYLEDKAFAINVISKSGTTTEPAIAFRVLKEMLEKQAGREKARELIFATTDANKGALKQLADQEGYETFVVPDDVGGRFSVLTAVGLLPIAAAGVSIDELMRGAQEGMDAYLKDSFEENDAIRYAAARYLQYQEKKHIEILVSYEPKLRYVQEWWKQLYGESEGKEGRGLFPASVNNTTDLHSMGQWIQEGPRVIFETVINVKKPSADLDMKKDEEDLDGLNYLAGRTLDEVNKKAMEGTRNAHVDGNVPNIAITIDALNPKDLGRLLYFFEVAVGVSGYLLGVNPFNQPGVEMYKTNMFQLLDKPGYERK